MQRTQTYFTAKLILFTLLCNWCNAQKPIQKPVQKLADIIPCDCKDPTHYITERQGQDLIDFYQSKYGSFDKKFKEQKIIVKQAACDNAKADICEGNKRVIMYNDCFVKLLNKNQNFITSVDKHILLHELGHHALEHVKNNDPKKHKNVGGVIKEPNRYQIFIKNNKIKDPDIVESEADFFALWFMKKLNPKFDFKKNFRDSLNLTVRSLKNSDCESSSQSISIFEKRLKAMDKFWDEIIMKKDNESNTGKKYLITDFAEVYYLSQYENRVFWDLLITTNVFFKGIPEFKSYGTTNKAFLYPLSDFASHQTGLMVSRHRFDSNVRLSAEFSYSSTKYGIYDEPLDNKRLIEDISLSYFNVTPKFELYLARFTNGNTYYKTKYGIYTAIGLDVQFPLKIQYSNYLTPTTNLVSRQSLSPRVELGFDMNKRTIYPNSLRLNVGYQWHRMQFKDLPQGSSSFSHNFSVGLQLAIHRK